MPCILLFVRELSLAFVCMTLTQYLSSDRKSQRKKPNSCSRILTESWPPYIELVVEILSNKALVNGHVQSLTKKTFLSFERSMLSIDYLFPNLRRLLMKRAKYPGIWRIFSVFCPIAWRRKRQVLPLVLPIGWSSAEAKKAQFVLQSRARDLR